MEENKELKEIKDYVLSALTLTNSKYDEINTFIKGYVEQCDNMGDLFVVILTLAETAIKKLFKEN